MLAGAAEVEVLEEELEVDKLIATLAFSSWVAFPFTYKKNTDFNIKAIKNSAFLPSAEHKSIYSEQCWEPVSVPADFQTMQADETPKRFSIQDSSKHLCLPQKKVSLQRHKGE